MTFTYSICYPDKEDIQYFKKEISGKEMLNIIKSFPWNMELQKDIHYYSPSIEINRIKDKNKLIISGLGKGRLSNYMVMLFIVKNDMVQNVFNQKEYRKAKVFEGQMSIMKTEELVNQFVTGSLSKELEKYFEGLSLTQAEDKLGILVKTSPKMLQI